MPIQTIQFRYWKGSVHHDDNSSDEGQRPDAPQPSNGLWLVCPVCKKLNPAHRILQTLLGSIVEFSGTDAYKEAMAFAQLLLQNKKKHRMTWIALFIIIPLLITVGSALLYIYSYTDLLWDHIPRWIPTLHPAIGDVSWQFKPYRQHDSSTTQPQGVLAWSFQTGGEIHSSPR